MLVRLAGMGPAVICQADYRHWMVSFMQVEEDEPSDFVRFDKFQPVMAKILNERRYRPSTEEQLVKAFEVSTCTYMLH